MPYLFTASLPTFLCASKLNPPLIDILSSTETNTALLLYVFSIRKQDESAHLDGSFFLSLGLSSFLLSNLIESRIGIEMQMKAIIDHDCFVNLFANDVLVGFRSIYADRFDTCLLGFSKFLKEGLQARLLLAFGHVREFASLSIKNEGHVAMSFPDRLFIDD